MPRTKNPAKQDEWIAEYFRNGGRKKAACDKIGMPYSTLKNWLKDPEFQARVEQLRDDWADTLRATAIRRAMEKSDTLLIFMLKALQPETYDDATRRDKWQAENGVQAAEAFIPVRAVLVRDEEPEGVRGNGEAKEH